MKRIILSLLLVCSMFISCDKMPMNGDLDGMWKIVEIEHNGIVQNTEDDDLYMSIQLKLFQLSTIPLNYVYGYFEHKDNKIHFWQFSYYSNNESTADDNTRIPESDKEFLKKWGYYSLDETFEVEKLNRNELILKSNSVRIKYVKF